MLGELVLALAEVEDLADSSFATLCLSTTLLLGVVVHKIVLDHDVADSQANVRSATI